MRDAPTQPTRRAVFVLGMHRSGTSALARLLNLVGVELGNDLLPPAADNETGFWEHREIQAIHDRLLRELRRGWASVSPLPADWQHQPQMAGFRDELAAAAKRDFQNSPMWGLKDPRLCFTLPLWREALADVAVPHGVLIVRNPAEVVRSLERRNGIAASRGYLLWLRSMLDAERDSRGMARTLTRYESLLQDWRGQLARIGIDLGIDWPISLDTAAEAVGEFLRPSLRHHTVEDAAFLSDPAVPEVVRRAYAAAVTAADRGDFAPLSTTLDELRPQLEDPTQTWTRFIADVEADYFSLGIDKHEMGLEMAEHVHEAHRQLAAAQTTADEQTRRAQANELELHAVTKHAAGLSEVVENLQARLAMSEQHAGNLQEHANYLQQHAANLREHATYLEGQVPLLTAQLTQAAEAATQQAAFLNGTIDNLQTRLAMSEQHASQLSARREELEAIREEHELVLQRLQQMWQSRSWRWAAALRGARALTREQLVAMSGIKATGAFSWRASGTARFLLPCEPMRGGIAVSLRVRSPANCRATLYFDSSRSFNDQQRVELGEIGGEPVEVAAVLNEPTFCFRLDLTLPDKSDFTIEQFEIRRR